MKDRFFPEPYHLYHLVVSRKVHQLVRIGRSGGEVVGNVVCDWHSGHDFKTSFANSFMHLTRELEGELFDETTECKHLATPFQPSNEYHEECSALSPWS